MSQKHYSKNEHHLDPQKIDSHALYVIEKLKQAGFEAYLVGGSVRDLLLGQHPKDFDISTSAKPEEVKKIFRSALIIGRRFRLVHVRFGRKILEVSTFRAGNPESDELIVRDNEWGTPEEDAMRRDFTINGLFYDPEEERIIDYVGGFPDIEKKSLRTIGEPYLRFRQDPVRMIRLLKFQARFGLDIDPEAKIALLECRSEIVKSSQARILEELLRMLESGASYPFFRLLTEHGLLELLSPALSSFLGSADGGEVYDFLKENDTIRKDPELRLPKRPVLLSALIYPMLHNYLGAHLRSAEKIPHLGEVQLEAKKIIHNTFHPFFNISRKMRAEITSILTGQYRLTPLEKKKLRYRIPSDPDFHLALHFLYLRARLEPGLADIYKQWYEHFEKSGPGAKPATRRRPRRRSR